MSIIFVTKPTPKAKQAEADARQALKDLPHLPFELVVAVGGDGTMLHAIKQHMKQDVVFAGISAGSLGLLETVEINQIQLLADALKSGKYDLLEAPLLGACFCDPVGHDAKQDHHLESIGHAFNDISVERRSGSAARFHLKIDDSAGTFIGDGVIFATPLGSTAYSLAAGGPIIDSEAQDTFVATPNNPHLSAIHSSLQRPHVFSSNRMIRIEVSGTDVREHPAQLVIDGQVVLETINRSINIYISSKRVKLLQLEGNGLRNRIENKRLGRL
jgi:NAD+ kinase